MEKEQIKTKTFKVGDLITCQTSENGSWITGEISEIHEDDGSASIKFDNQEQWFSITELYHAKKQPWQDEFIGRVKDRFEELHEKEFVWKSFYHGWLEGRADMLKAADESAKRKDELIEKMIAVIPTNWTDPFLTGDTAVIGKPPYDCQDIERLLLAIKTRLEEVKKKEGTKA